MTPKFKLGDIVQFVDKYKFKPARKAVSIGVVTGIHIEWGDKSLRRDNSNGISYSVSCSSKPKEENDLKPLKMRYLKLKKE